MMRKGFYLFLSLCFWIQWGMAQTPKWVEKAKRAVFSVVTYDKDDKILNTGNGFFVSKDGIAVSDYALFKGAQRAVIIDTEGRQMPVLNIMGADDMYDVVKFRVDITGKKVNSLTLATAPPAAGSEIYLLPYSTQKDRSCTFGHVKSIDKMVGNYFYYTLQLRLKEKMVSCPLVTAEGTVFGLAQKSSGQDTTTVCYAADVRYAMDQKISALSYTDFALKDIGIKKALPDTEEQALVFLYMASAQLPSDKYAEVLNDFVEQYPNSADGYMRRAVNRASMSDAVSMQLVEADMDRALELAQDKAGIRFERAKLIYNYVLNNSEKTYDNWTLDKALEEIREAVVLQPLPVYIQLEGDILFSKQDYASALSCYEQVNRSSLASPASFFRTAQIKEMMQAPVEEIVALLDSCVSRCPMPYTDATAPYLLARAQALLNAGQARRSMLDYDAYFKAVDGKVNDSFYYYREQASLQAHQYQRALDDLAKAIELNPKELLYRAELAVVNIRVGRSEEAVKVLQEALQIDPSYSEAYRLMGLAYIYLKKKNEACEALAKAKELGNENVDDLIEKNCK